MNNIILVGNLVRDPELTQTQSGVSLCKFTLAVNRNYTNANGEREADFINIVTWRGLAENCGRYLAKGKKVAVCGSLQTSSYEDNDGNKRYRTDVVADEVEFLPSGNKEGAEPQSSGDTAQKKKTVHELTLTEDDGLPF